MRILKKKERGYRFYSEKYDLNGAYAGQNDIPIGVLLLYVLVKNTDSRFQGLSAEAVGEIGESRNIYNVESVKFFPELKKLAEIFVSQELVIWELTVDYEGIQIYVSGRTYGTVLSVRTPLISKVNVLPLMNQVENKTYGYNLYDENLIKRMINKYKMNQRVAVQTIAKMERHADIFGEFIHGIKSDSFNFPDESPITVEGYTARRLFDNYPLSELGAYNYLIYLRENPKEALLDLKKGLPRK